MIIEGSVEEIRFFNEENGYCILVLDVDGDMTIAVGTFPPLAEGENVRLTGEYVTHPKFGRQFKSQRAERIAPTTADGVFRFISSGIIKGIGPKTASAMLAAFGDKTLEVLEKKPQLLAKLRGISLPKAKEFSDEYKKHISSQQVIMFLQDKGLTINMALKIYKKYGQNTIATLSLNPYTLIEDIAGIGFLTADRIAATLGIEKDSEFRIRAGVLCALSEEGEQNGNTFLFYDELLVAAERLLGQGGQLLDSAIGGLLISNSIKIIEISGKKAVFLRSGYASEYGCAVRLVNLHNSFLGSDEKDKQNSDGDIKKELDLYRQIHGITLNDQQSKAVQNSLSHGVSIITGGPGTGKTTIIKCLLHLFDKRGESYILMAPTGRAAKRITESTGAEASTIHRALKLPSFGENPTQLTVQNVIVDEVSMMDVYLFNTLLKHIRDGTRLILLGDKDQLPSVGAGNVLADVLQSMPCTTLTQIYRQADTSQIVKNAHLINSGHMPNLSQNDNDFFFLKRESAQEIAETITQLVTTRLPKFLDCDAGKIQVLCPMKNGGAGTKALNDMLSNALNPPCGTFKAGGGVLEAGGWAFKEGSKVMQTSNNYSQSWTRGSEQGEGVFNGDLGIIESIATGTREAVVLFEDGRRAVYSENLDELMLAYAITVHKSQGSEFEAIVMPVLPGSPMILTRNLLYTAVTRAKRLVVLVGLEYAVKRMIDNNFIATRNSALSHFIAEAQKNYDKLFSKSDLTKDPQN